MEWATLFILAIVVETVVENLKNAIPALTRKTWLVMLSTIVLGVLMAFVCNADVLAVLGLPERIPYVGMVLTGVLIGGGSNMIYDLMARVKGSKEKALNPSLAIPDGNSTIKDHEDMGVM